MKRSLVVVVAGSLLVAAAGCSGGGGAAAPVVTVTATVGSTRFLTRDHFLASGEMQISGEPLAEAMQRDLGGYSRDLVPPDVYFDSTSADGHPWIDLAGFSTGIESYEYSKQPMNAAAFELGAGTALAFAPAVGSTAALISRVQRFAAESHAEGRFVFPAGTFPTGNGPGDANPVGLGKPQNNPVGWPGIWPTVHLFADFDPTIAPANSLSLQCSISSDDTPGSNELLFVNDYECDATSLHLADRAAQVDSVVGPGPDGFSAWKYGLWTLNYLQVMHDSTEAAVSSVAESDLASVGTAGNVVVGADDGGAPTAPGTFIGSSDIEGFQAAMFIEEADDRADDWLKNLTTTDGETLGGFASLLDAESYDEQAPLRWFPRSIGVTETSAPGDTFPRPVSWSIVSPDSELMDQIGIAMGYAEFWALTDTANADVGGSQPARVYFDGDPFPADDQVADGESTLHDRAGAMMRVALVDLDRMHVDPATGLLVDSVAVTPGPGGPTLTRGTTVSTLSVGYALIGLRTALRALDSQLELYSNETPDTAIVSTPLDVLPLNAPGDASATLTGRVRAIRDAETALLYDKLTDDTGRAWDGWDVAADQPVDGDDLLDAHAAAVRGLFTAYLSTGDVRYRDRALAVFGRMERVFYDEGARIWGATPAPVDTVEYTPLRFALLQSALREVYELSASRPRGDALALDLEDRIAQLNKLVLNGWDDRNGDQHVDYPDECVTDDDTGTPHGGLQMAERALTGEPGYDNDADDPLPRPTRDKDQDCVPEIDDAHLPAALAASITFHVERR